MFWDLKAFFTSFILITRQTPLLPTSLPSPSSHPPPLTPTLTSPSSHSAAEASQPPSLQRPLGQPADCPSNHPSTTPQSSSIGASDPAWNGPVGGVYSQEVAEGVTAEGVEGEVHQPEPCQPSSSTKQGSQRLVTQNQFYCNMRSKDHLPEVAGAPILI